MNDVRVTFSSLRPHKPGPGCWTTQDVLKNIAAGIWFSDEVSSRLNDNERHPVLPGDMIYVPRRDRPPETTYTLGTIIAVCSTRRATPPAIQVVWFSYPR